MQTIIGRLVADAQIRELKDGRKLVAFTVAQNERFKAKGSDQIKQLTNYFNCSYWVSTGIAAYLKRGMLVSTSGRIGINAWKNAEGDARANLTLHVQHIQLHGTSNAAPAISNAPAPEPQTDDLPF